MVFLDSEVEATGVTGIELVDDSGVRSKLIVARRRSVVGDATVAVLSVFVVDRLCRIVDDVAVSKPVACNIEDAVRLTGPS